MNPVPLASALVSLVGVVLLARVFAGYRGLAVLFFALQLGDMIVGQLLEFAASVWGWSTVGYKVYYMSSPLSAGLLAVAVLFALGYRRAGLGFLAYTMLVSLVLASKLVSVEVDLTVLEARGEAVGGMALPDDVRIFSPLLTIPSGLIVLLVPVIRIVGKRVGVPGMVGGLLGIVVGNLVFLVAGSLLRRGMGEAFLVLELVATVILAWSFLRVARALAGKRGIGLS